MIILIGAVSCTGKTLMAQRLLERYKVPYLSIDHLKMGLYRANMGCGFTPTDSDEHIEARLWPILEGIIRTNVENGQHLIIEGCYLFPGRLASLDTETRAQIIPVFMGFSEQYIRKNLQTGIFAHRSAIEQRGWSEDRTAGQLIAEHAAYRDRCLRSGIPYHEIDTDYAKDTARIYAWIDEQVQRIRKKEPGMPM